MDEEKTAKTIGEEPKVGTADTDNAADTATNEETFSDGSDQAAEKPKQTKEQNAEYARRRREAETNARLKSEREKAIIETLDGKNPYTGAEMKDSADVEEFLTQREIARNGGDPVGDYSKHLKDKEREKARQEAEQSQKEAWFRDDCAAFSDKHPDVDIDELVRDPRFLSFADGKIGHRPLTEIYDGFLRLTDGYEKAVTKKAAQIAANASASPGSLTGSEPAESGYFTREQVQAMSQEDVSRNLDAIRKSMKKW